MVSAEAHEQRVALLGTVPVLPAHVTASVWQTVCEQTRTTERARQWTLAAWAECWTAVLLRAPPSVTQALAEAAASPRAGWPAVQASAAAFCARCQRWWTARAWTPWPTVSNGCAMCARVCGPAVSPLSRIGIAA